MQTKFDYLAFKFLLKLLKPYSIPTQTINKNRLRYENLNLEADMKN